MCAQYIYRTTILAAVAFLDAFQKVADMATNSRGKEGSLLSLHSDSRRCRLSEVVEALRDGLVVVGGGDLQRSENLSLLFL